MAKGNNNEPGWVTELRNCKKCGNLIEKGALPVFYEAGDYSADILFIFEAPNRQDTFNSDKV